MLNDLSAASSLRPTELLQDCNTALKLDLRGRTLEYPVSRWKTSIARSSFSALSGASGRPDLLHDCSTVSKQAASGSPCLFSLFSYNLIIHSRILCARSGAYGAPEFFQATSVERNDSRSGRGPFSCIAVTISSQRSAFPHAAHPWSRQLYSATERGGALPALCSSNSLFTRDSTAKAPSVFGLFRCDQAYMSWET